MTKVRTGYVYMNIQRTQLSLNFWFLHYQPKSFNDRAIVTLLRTGHVSCPGLWYDLVWLHNCGQVDATKRWALGVSRPWKIKRPDSSQTAELCNVTPDWGLAQCVLLQTINHWNVFSKQSLLTYAGCRDGFFITKKMWEGDRRLAVSLAVRTDTVLLLVFTSLSPSLFSFQRSTCAICILTRLDDLS